MKRARRYCQICGKSNHITNDCWNLQRNAHLRPGFLGTINKDRDAEPSGAVGTADASEESNVDEQSEQSEEE